MNPVHLMGWAVVYVQGIDSATLAWTMEKSAAEAAAKAIGAGMAPYVAVVPCAFHGTFAFLVPA